MGFKRCSGDRYSYIGKRGEINWFIVSIISAVLTLVVFVFIIVSFPYEQSIDRVACAESITLRGFIPSELPKTSVSVSLKDTISVRCKTRNVCITTKSGKGNCTGLGKDFDTMRLTGKTSLERETQIKMFLAREMVDCWNMFGEGKLQIFSRDATTKSFTVSGIICDKIEFDNSVTTGEENVTEINGLVMYMLTHKAPNRNVSYMDYLRETPEGQTAKNLYGSLVPNTQQTIGENISNSDVIKLDSVKTIVYMESTLSTLSQKVFGVMGVGLGIWGGSSLGMKAMAAGSFVGGILGGGVGDSLFTWWNKDKLCPPLESNTDSLPEDCGKHVGGLVLTDYSKEGLSKFNIDSFENL